MPSEFTFGGPNATVGALRPIHAVSPRAQLAPGSAKGAARAAAHSAVVERSLELDPGQPPIDTDRVQQVRRAIERGDYPIVPAKVADAIIAAGILLRTGK
jgi:negative regulator of flagellin synthesis FlgM